MNLSERGRSITKYALMAIIAIALSLVVISVSAGFIMDYYWFSAIGFREVFMTNLKYQLLLLFIGWITPVVFLFLAWGRVKKALDNKVPAPGDLMFRGLSIFIGLGVGWWFKDKYLIVLKYLNQVPWESTDPVFGNDISFYIFTLPFIKLLLSFIAIVSGIVLVLSLFTFGIGKGSIGERERGDLGEFGFSEDSEDSAVWSFPEFLRSWTVILPIATLFIVGALNLWLGRYSYLWGFDPGSSIPTEASYMAVNYHIPYKWVTTFGVLLAGGLIIHVIKNFEEIAEKAEIWGPSKLKKEIAIVGLLIIILIIIPQGVFGAINSLNVQPNEPGVQQKYLESTIQNTKEAYGLSDMDEIPYKSSPENDLTSDEALNSPTVKNARIVDYRPIQQAYKERQDLRLYYDFPNVDVDRYKIENGKRLAVISGREIDSNSVPSRGGEWQNQQLIYTHGFGAVVSPANEVEPDGSPILSVRDIPPVSDWGSATVRDPRIYFGEETNEYAMVGADNLNEFDYPRGEEDAYNRFVDNHPNRGIDISNSWKKLVSWFYTGDFELLVSDYVGDESRLLLHRNVHERVRKIAPFLRFDSDAHLFVENNGSLKYLLNGITHARNYPYSYTDEDAPGYLSDSVKSFIDASSGEVELYPIREDDPIVDTFSKIYPDLFKEEEMSQDYRDHLIYPSELFETQMNIYRRYHMKNYRTFYQQEGLWNFSVEKYHGATKRVEAYNIIYDARNLPDFESRSEEFMLVKPFTPEGKNNLTAWVGVGQDEGNYGKMITLNFPEGVLTRGPRQIESIIDQNTTISQQTSLWDQRGSNVLRGNLLALPVSNDILYIEPLYLTATDLGYPQLKRIIAVYEDRAVMENTLERAVLSALGERATTPEPVPGDNVAPSLLVELVTEYLELNQRYNQLIGENRYAQAGLVKENMLDIERDMKDQID